MFYDLIFSIITSFLNWYNLWAPAWTLQGNALTLTKYLVISGVQWNPYLPVKHMYYIVGLIISFELVILLYKVLIGIISLVRGSGKPDI